MAEWDRQPEEPTLWFGRFERYRMMGAGRSMLGCVHAEEADAGREKRSSKVPGAWDKAAQEWRWKERAAAWDDAQNAKFRRVEESELEQRRKAWINQALAIQGVGVKALAKLDEVLDDPDALEAMSPRDMLAYLEAGMKLELLARGQATEITQNEHSVAVTVEQRRTRLLGILSALRDRGGTPRN